MEIQRARFESVNYVALICLGRDGIRTPVTVGHQLHSFLSLYKHSPYDLWKL